MLELWKIWNKSPALGFLFGWETKYNIYYYFAAYRYDFKAVHYGCLRSVFLFPELTAQGGNMNVWLHSITFAVLSDSNSHYTIYISMNIISMVVHIDKTSICSKRYAFVRCYGSLIKNMYVAQEKRFPCMDLLWLAGTATLQIKFRN